MARSRILPRLAILAALLSPARAGAQTSDDGAAPQPIPERAQKLLAAIDVYIHYIHDTGAPEDDDLVGMKFLAADTYRRYHHDAEAIPLLRDIIDHHPRHPAAEPSANLLLDLYNRRQDYRAMMALVDRLDGDPGFLDGKPALRDVLARLKVQILRNGAEGCERGAKPGAYAAYVACGQRYLDIYNRDPEAPGNDEVLYNAGVWFEKGKSISAAILAYDLLENNYPGSRLTARAIARLGKVYGDIAFYDRAADKLEQYARKYPGEKDAHDAMSEAVLFRKGIGDDARAIEDTKYFIKTFRRTRPEEAAAAMFSLTSVYENQATETP